MTNNKLVVNFLKAIEKEGDIFITSGDVDEDVNTIRNVIASQGHWSGHRLKYYFDEDFNLLRTESRW